ncbi:MAG: M50 family metallopeptidase [Candidatus Dormibacteraceae bacterium]
MAVLTPLIAVVAIPIMFLILVAPHEGGHFALSKLFGVKVHEYSLFMGTRLWSTVRGGTTYAVRLIPLGGFVRLAGMEPGEYDEPDGFYRHPVWQRILILLAGPFVNFVLAALIVTAISLTEVNSDPGKIVDIVSNSPAVAAGLHAGDSIKSVDEHPVASAQDIRNAENAHGGRPLHLTVRRQNGGLVHLTVQPRFNRAQHDWAIGIYSATFTTSQALVNGVTFPYTASSAIAHGIYQLATGQIPGGILGREGVTGPIGIATITYASAASGWFTWLTAVAFISVALGLTNLLPIPALDGGRILFVLFDGASGLLRGRPLDRNWEALVNRVGAVALLALIVFVTYFDVQRLALHQFPGTR